MAASTPYLKISGVVFDPVNPSLLPNNAIYVDQVSKDLSTKGDGGGTGAIAGSGGGSASFSKTMQNLSGATIPLGRPVAKKPDGSIAEAEAVKTGDTVVIGVALAAIANSDTGAVALIGQNVAGAVAGLGFAPGDPVYLADGGGYTNDAASLNSSNDVILRFGYADCAEGTASNLATDLIIFPEVVSTP